MLLLWFIRETHRKWESTVYEGLCPCKRWEAINTWNNKSSPIHRYEPSALRAIAPSPPVKQQLPGSLFVLLMPWHLSHRAPLSPMSSNLPQVHQNTPQIPIPGFSIFLHSLMFSLSATPCHWQQFPLWNGKLSIQLFSFPLFNLSTSLLSSHPMDRSSARGICRFTWGGAGSPHTLVKCFSQACMCKNHPGIIIKYRFWFSRSGRKPEVLHLQWAPRWPWYKDTVQRVKFQ